MEEVIEQRIKEFFAYENGKFILPKYKEDLTNWIIDDYRDDYNKGELAEVAVKAMQKLFLCKSTSAVLSIYNFLIASANTNYWCSSIIDEIITLIAKYSKNGEKLYELRFPNFNKSQLEFYNKIKAEHQEFYSNVIEK